MSNATLRALYVLAADYHSGQWSRGYQFGTRVGRLMTARGMSFDQILNWQLVRQSPEYAKYESMAERYF